MSNRIYVYFEESSLVDEAIAVARETGGTIVTNFIGNRIILNQKGCESILIQNKAEIPLARRNAIGIENWAKVETMTGRIDAALGAEFVELREMDPGPARGAFSLYKLLFDMLCVNFLELTEFMKAAGDAHFIVLRRPENNLAYDELLYHNFSSLMPDICDYVLPSGLRRQISIREAAAIPRRQSAVDIMADGARWLRSELRLRRAQIRRGNNVLVMEGSHDVALLCELPGAKGLSYVHWKDELDAVAFGADGGTDQLMAVRERIRQAFGALERDEQFRQALRFKEGDMFPVVVKRSLRYFEKIMGSFVVRWQEVNALFDKWRFAFLVTSTCRVSLKESLVLGFARTKKIPIVAYQEGGGAGLLNWPLFNIDCRHADYFLTYGVGVLESGFIEKGKAELLAVGSLRLAGMKKRCRPREALRRRPTIFFVVDILKDWANHYPYNGGNAQDGIPFHKLVLAMMRKIDSVNWVIKTIPRQRYLYDEFIAGPEWGGVRVEDAPLTAILDEADGFILDFPATAFAECLLTGKPVALLYEEQRCQLLEDAKRDIGESGYISSDPERFSGILELMASDCLEGRRKDIENRFLTRYCFQDDTEIKVVRALESFLH